MAMTEIVILTGDSRRMLAEHLNYAENRELPVRICVDNGTVKVKVDNGTWSPPLGALDPDCEAAEWKRQEDQQEWTAMVNAERDPF